MEKDIVTGTTGSGMSFANKQSMLEDMPKLRAGDSIGGIYKKLRVRDNKECWELIEDKITKVVQTKKDGWKYYTKSKFYPLYAEDVDSNTKQMENAIGKGYIITKEIFELNEKTRPFAENWISWANANPNKAVSILDSKEEDEREM